MKKKILYWKLKGYWIFALIQSAAIGLYHKDTISDDVYDSGMVFYNVSFLEDELFTLHSSAFAIFGSNRKY